MGIHCPLLQISFLWLNRGLSKRLKDGSAFWQGCTLYLETPQWGKAQWLPDTQTELAIDILKIGYPCEWSQQSALEQDNQIL